jgi:hypothetical protein
MGLGKMLLVAAAVGGVAYALAPAGEPTTGLVPGDETVESYRGHGIAIGEIKDAKGPEPFRWRIQDPDGEAIANAFGWAADAAEALAAAKTWIDSNIPNLPPVPEAAEAPEQPVCEDQLRDGDFDICVYKTPTAWAYRATDAGGMALSTEGGYATKSAAKIGAWQFLAARSTMLVDSPTTRRGVTLFPDGTLKVDNMETWVSWATGPVAQAIGSGQGSNAIVLDVLARTWPAVNPFRLRPNGDEISVVAERIAGQQDPQQVARDMFGPFTVGAETV